jgi:hypothetical protein
VDLLAQRGIRDAQEAPRLHQADAGSAVSRFEQSLQSCGVDWVGNEMAHIAALGDRPVDGSSFGIAESKAGVTHEVKASLSRGV